MASTVKIWIEKSTLPAVLNNQKPDWYTFIKPEHILDKYIEVQISFDLLKQWESNKWRLLD